MTSVTFQLFDEMEGQACEIVDAVASQIQQAVFDAMLKRVVTDEAVVAININIDSIPYLSNTTLSLTVMLSPTREDEDE